MIYCKGKSSVKYDPESGIFTWVTAYRKPRFNGAVATRPMPNGYLYIKIGGACVSASRVAWELFFGPIPNGLEIDHINRNRADNRIGNLRLVTRAENLKNRIFRENACKRTGVSLHKKTGLYRARYCNKTLYARTIDEASAMYETMKKEGKP